MRANVSATGAVRMAQATTGIPMHRLLSKRRQRIAFRVWRLGGAPCSGRRLTNMTVNLPLQRLYGRGTEGLVRRNLHQDAAVSVPSPALQPEACDGVGRSST